MKLFPHILVRISGGDFSRMELLKLTKTPLILEELERLREKIERVRQQVTAKLHDVIPKKIDPKIQNLLLNCRRDIFNGRDIPPENLDQIMIHLPNSLKKELKDYLKLNDRYHHLWREGETHFMQESVQARKHLYSLARDETLQKGLLLSSQSLLKRIAPYTSADPVKLNKKNRQTEQGLIKYISRMYCKTSPFSTFTNLAMGRPEPRGGEPPFFRLQNNKPGPTVHHIRLNNFLYKYLKTLLCKNPDLYPLLPIRPNPTLQTSDGHYLFLTNNENVEAFQRIPADPVLDVLLEQAAEKNEGVPLREMIRSLIGNGTIDAQEPELESYIIQLMEYGFLEFNIGVSGIDPDWDISLRTVLGNLPGAAGAQPLLEELSRTLEHLRDLADSYGQAPASLRDSILDSAFREFREICMRLHQAAGLPEEERLTPEERRKRKPSKTETTETLDAETVFTHRSSTYFLFKPEHMFYEDTTIGNTLLVEETALNEFVRDLHHLLQNMRQFEGHLDDRDKMLHFFDQTYGPSAVVPLMTFYEEFYRQFKKPEAEAKQNNETPEALTVPRLQIRHQRRQAWIESYKDRLKEEAAPGQDVVYLTQSALEESLHRFLPETPPQPEGGCSYGSFIQFYNGETRKGDKTLMGVVNATFTGFGKLFSRFLHIFPQEITGDLRRWNLEAGENTLLVEDTDASYFNANLHPPLLPYEVRLPGGHNSLPPSRQLPVTELLVKISNTGEQLQLVHGPTGKRVHVLDLGFQSHSGRSQLFQLLEKFTLAEQLFFWPAANAAIAVSSDDRAQHQPNGISKESRVRVLPRLVYRDRLVLRRKSWDIPEGIFPLKEPGDSDWDYFARVNRWRRHLDIPDEVFVYVVDRFRDNKGFKKESAEPGPKPSRDDYKPQYICFHNPFLVDLFHRLLKRTRDHLRVVEMLPGSRQLFAMGNPRHITEFTVQWYTEKS